MGNDSQMILIISVQGVNADLRGSTASSNFDGGSSDLWPVRPNETCAGTRTFGHTSATWIYRGPNCHKNVQFWTSGRSNESDRLLGTTASRGAQRTEPFDVHESRPGWKAFGSCMENLEKDNSDRPVWKSIMPPSNDLRLTWMLEIWTNI